MDPRQKIRLFIAGAQKCGTTSLKHYLGEHPSVVTHLQKEFAYFYDDEEFRGGWNAAVAKYYGFHADNTVRVAKNAGLYVKESAVQRLHEHNPECHIVLLLRNPADRAYSAYQMEKNYGHISDDFSVVRPLLSSRPAEDWRYEFFIKMGMYSEYIKTMLKYFPKEQFTFISYENLQTQPAVVCKNLYETLQIDSSFQPDISVRYNVTHKMHSSAYAKMVTRLLKNDNPLKKVARRLMPRGQDVKLGEMLRNVNKSASKPEKLSDDFRSTLTEFYRPYNEQLSDLTGIDFNVWNKLSDKS